MVAMTWSLRNLKPREEEGWGGECCSSQGWLLGRESGFCKRVKKRSSRNKGGMKNRPLRGRRRGSLGEVGGVTLVTSHPLFPLQVQGIKVPNQEFGLSENEPGTNFLYAKFDGIMGMAYPALSLGRATTALQGMLQEGALTSPVFSFYLSR